MVRRLTLFTTVVAVLSGACVSDDLFPPVQDGATLSDTFQSNVFGPQQVGIHSPYVTGATVGIVVSPSEGQDLTGWTLKSSNSAVLTVAQQIHPSTTTSLTRFDGGTTTVTQSVATLTAVAPGNATLAILNPSGTTVSTSQAIAVVTPDHVKLYPIGDFLVGSSTDEVQAARVVVGGKATFLAQYYAHGKQAFGVGALDLKASGVSATATSPAVSPANDFIFVSPSQAGSGSVGLSVGGAAVGTLAVTAVEPSVVTALDLVANSETAAAGLGVLYARATDANGDRVYGAPAAWSIPGRKLDTTTLDPAGDPADLFFYPVDSADHAAVSATYGKLAVTAPVQASTQYVASTADAPKLIIPQACAIGAAPGALSRPTVAVGLALGLLGLLGRRRGRRHAASRCAEPVRY